METAVFTGIGARPRQEDSCDVLRISDERALLTVADGMGGHGYGDEASRNVVTALADYWREHASTPDTPDKIEDAVSAVGREYDRLAAGREMGSTLVMAAVDGRKVLVAHCGDSRIYVWHKAKGQRFHTADHVVMNAFGWEFVRNAFFTGMCSEVIPEIRELEMKPGDRLMLCSDGVFKFVPDADLWHIFTSDSSLPDVASKLEAYCQAMSRDNYTAVIAEF